VSDTLHTTQNGCACGCCDGDTRLTPQRVDNRPGLTALAYRVGTHPTFKRSMLSCLSSVDYPALADLRTRDDDDFAIAIIDAWAIVADVLTFYQERLANESYLRTALERLSVGELARLIGYRLRPGVAASTYLAFTLEEAPGSPDQATKRTAIEAGTRVQSVPAPGETPQAFETIADIEARVEWNAIRPRLTTRHPVAGDTTAPLLFEGLATGLKAGDGLLLIPDDGGSPVFRQVKTISLQSTEGRTQVILQPLSTSGATVIGPILNLGLGALATVNVGSITSTFRSSTPVSGSDFHAAAMMSRFDTGDVFANIIATRPPAPAVFAFRIRAAVFGHNAPRWDTLPVAQRIGEWSPDPDDSDFKKGIYHDRSGTWADGTLAAFGTEPANSKQVFLDQSQPTVVKGGWIVLKDGGTAQPYEVTDATDVSKADFAVTAKVTRVSLDTSFGLSNFHIRNTTVFAQSEELRLARLPIATAVAGAEVELEGFVDGLTEGQVLLVSGELTTMRGVRACERVTIVHVQHLLDVDGYTVIGISALTHSYVRSTVVVFGNVAPATHGETVEEVLGSGDASRAYQQFSLRQSPLTYTTADTPAGARSTLQVRVNDLLWHEAPALYGHGPTERIYATQLEEDGATTVTFGDAVRPPTGQQNIRARYRKGIGKSGLVKAGQLSLLLSRPSGVKAVVNPVPSSGAAEPESADAARRNAPLGVLTLDRAVSLKDYEDFARAFAGVEKSLATWFAERGTTGVLLTVAGPDGAEIAPDSDTARNLIDALGKAGDPFLVCRVRSYRPALFRIEASVKIHADYIAARVIAAVENTLRLRFGFDAGSFGDTIAMSDVMTAIQVTPGVIAVDVDQLYRVDAGAAGLNSRLRASPPVIARNGTDAGAELLMLDPAPLDLRVMS
jgi:predicted phage baseplate assembly protein